ncbi:pilus assembly protein TadG-related protein [Hyalangium gracile]|uniref:pilus assembly protein TadG-related protein n=1 Tax=Hyalangium gracile TaxID=394092 RepID=UPI001CCF16CA|nr:pilus assembly protein TadG-related protein [Hyalangium gracile]
MRPSLRQRGQTLVIFALTLLLLTLMVCMTLSIGMKAREKMELQTVADAAAYSQAVATARAFNGASLLNRAFMGHMVVMTGVESLISWSGYYRASLDGARQAYDVARAPYVALLPCCLPNSGCSQFCSCARQALQDISDAQDDLRTEDDNVENTWQGLDARAGHEARALQLGSISQAQRDAYTELERILTDASLAQRIADQANQGVISDITASTGASQVNTDEIKGDESCNGDGAFCTRRNAGNKNHFIYAAMGSRGYAFVTGREGGADPIKNKLQSVIPQRDIVNTLEDEGSGYFASTKNHSRRPSENGAVWGDDHGSLTLTFGRGQAPCPPTSIGNGSMEAHVKSNDLPNPEQDEHVWTGGSDAASGRDREHTMGNCTLCPGMWPPHADYNYKNVATAENAYGQPKNYAVIQRDLQSRNPDPWNLFFRFRFATTNNEFDNRGIRLSDGTDISRATALSAGIAYYHHRGGNGLQAWVEPPNFLNPFWRATLISAWVDRAGQDDVGRALDASGASFTREAYDALRGVGYAAW